jgi:hypothetical protein
MRSLRIAKPDCARRDTKPDRLPSRYQPRLDLPHFLRTTPNSRDQPSLFWLLAPCGTLMRRGEARKVPHIAAVRSVPSPARMLRLGSSCWPQTRRASDTHHRSRHLQSQRQPAGPRIDDRSPYEYPRAAMPIAAPLIVRRVRFRRKRHYLCLPLTNQIPYSSALRLCSGKQQRTLCPLFCYHWRQSAMPFGSKLDFAYECDQRPVAARWSDHLHADWKAVLIEAGGQRDCRQP